MGGGTVLRSATAKVAVAGIGAVNGDHRGLPVSATIAASRSLVLATLSAQGVCEEAVTAAPATVPWNQWNIDDWEETVAVVQEGSGEPMPRVIFGGAPSLEETKAATNELKDAIDMYGMWLTDTRDPNVWDAFLQNDALKDFTRSQNSGIQFPLMDLKPEEYVDDVASEDWTSPPKLEMSVYHENSFVTMIYNVKVTVVEMANNVSNFLHNFFSTPEAPADRASAGSDGIDRTAGASFVLLVALVIMVVLLKRV